MCRESHTAKMEKQAPNDSLKNPFILMSIDSEQSVERSNLLRSKPLADRILLGLNSFCFALSWWSKFSGDILGLSASAITRRKATVVQHKALVAFLARRYSDQVTRARFREEILRWNIVSRQRADAAAIEALADLLISSHRPSPLAMR